MNNKWLRWSLTVDKYEPREGGELSSTYSFWTLDCSIDLHSSPRMPWIFFGIETVSSTNQQFSQTIRIVDEQLSAQQVKMSPDWL